MTVLSGFMDSLGSFFFGLFAFLIVLSTVVFIHELGHFLVARWCGVKVTTFSIGFGREIFGFNDKHGARWRVAWIPLGGYVKFMDDENGASIPNREAMSRMSEAEREGSFHAKPVWKRAAVVAAGPIANFLLAIGIFMAMFLVIGARETAPRVDQVMPNTPAERAGFKSGDVILEIDGRKIASFTDVVRLVSTQPERELLFKIDRGGVPLTMKVIPELREEDDNFGGKMRRGLIGIRPMATPQTVKVRSVGPVEAFVLGVQECEFIVSSTFGYLRDVIVGRQKADQLGGPARIAEVSRQVAKISPEAVLHLIAVISVSVGLINLFPIPILDGGHLMFYAIEALRRRPLSERSQEFGFKVGLAVVLALMLFSTWNDRFIVWKWLTGAG